MRVPNVWGATAAEVAAVYPCDRLVDGDARTCVRAVTVRAAPEIVFRWLCQLKLAPYSYDLLDNGGRRSPPALTPGADDLEAGQRVMRIFELVEFAPGDHLTLRMDSPRAVRLFGSIAVSYVVRPEGDGASRLIAKLVIPGGAAIPRWALAWGDLVMMRRQLLNLARLSEGRAW